jgi:hypothetical protein
LAASVLAAKMKPGAELNLIMIGNSVVMGVATGLRWHACHFVLRRAGEGIHAGM